MKIKLVIEMIIFLSAGSALALPVVNLNQAVDDSQHADCPNRRGQTNDFRKLIVKASTYGADDREVISRNAKQVGMNAAEVEQALTCTGRIYCPGIKGGQHMIGSAGAICPVGKRENGRCAPDRLATVAHLFVDKEKIKMRANMADCQFESYKGHKTALVISDLKVVNPSEIYSAAVPPDKRTPNVRLDPVVIRLKNPIPGCDPYDLADPASSPLSGDEVIALTHKQVDQPMDRFDGSEPNAYKCEVTKVFAPRAGNAGAFYSKCDLNGGGSGGFNLVRNSDNRLAVAGLFSSAQLPDRNGQEYDEAEKNYTASSGTNAHFLQLALHPGVRPDTQITQRDVPTLRPTGN